MSEHDSPGAVAHAGAGGNQVSNQQLSVTTPTAEKPDPIAARPAIRLIEWVPFPWDVIGCATVACGDLVVEDVLICAIGTAAFALIKRPAGMTEREWGELGDAVLALVRKADPEALKGTTELFGSGQ